MARLGVFSDKPRKWFPFDEDTEVNIEFLSKDRILEIQKRAAKQAKLSGGDLEILTNKLIGEATVKGWRKASDHNHPGLLDAAGNSIPFTPENRDMLMKCCREFSNFVNDASIDSHGFLAEEDTSAAEVDAAKND